MSRTGVAVGPCTLAENTHTLLAAYRAEGIVVIHSSALSEVQKQAMAAYYACFDAEDVITSSGGPNAENPDYIPCGINLPEL